MSGYARVATAGTPPTRRARADQVPNQGGGFSFMADDWTRLERFLILGVESPTYYASREQTIQSSVTLLDKLLKVDGPRVVETVVEVSTGGRAPKNDPAVFVLAYASARGDDATRTAAALALSKVCRIGTDLFAWAEARKKLGAGWGRRTVRAVSAWYLDKSVEDLAYQVIKYQGRQTDGAGSRWTHADLLASAHVKTNDQQRQAIFRWVVGADLGDRVISRRKANGEMLKAHYGAVGALPDRITAFERMKTASTSAEIVRLVSDYNMPRECVPTQWLNDPSVWDALLCAGHGMPLRAMVRNLGKMTSIGLIAPMSDAAKFVAKQLTNGEVLRRARVHPLAILTALLTYKNGRGVKGSLSWSPEQMVLSALDTGFYEAFKQAEPTDKNWLLGLDVSSSMGGGTVAGIPGFTPAMGTAAMALMLARVENSHHIYGFAHTFKDLGITARDHLGDAMRKVHDHNFGSTNCALPMEWALEKKVPVDVFVVMTDSEVNSGRSHPFQALKAYRQGMGRPAKMITVGMVVNDFTIADPEDGGMLDVVGFDANAAQFMTDFARDKVTATIEE